MLVFLDTEFTDFHDARLISIGLVAQSGEEFYAELPVDDSLCGEFTRHTVLPLLGREPHAFCADDWELATRLRTWLSIVKRNEPLTLCFDLELDWTLFAKATGTLPDFCAPRLLKSSEINELLLYSFVKTHGLPEHHALYDARGMHYAFRERR